MDSEQVVAAVSKLYPPKERVNKFFYFIMFE
jgi:hypothetical protein